MDLLADEVLKLIIKAKCLSPGNLYYFRSRN